MTNLLCVENLRVAYPSSRSVATSRWAVDDVSFTLDGGRIRLWQVNVGTGRNAIITVIHAN